MANRLGVVTASTLNLRVGPDAASAKVGELARGAQVEVLGTSGHWYHVRDGVREGFVSGDHLRVRLPPTAEAGFLASSAALRSAPLPPPAPEHLPTTRRHNNIQRSVAGTWNGFGGLLRVLGDTIGIPAHAAASVLCVESGGQGFVDDRMVIRFENHVFHDRWGKANEAVFRQHFTFDPAKRWLGHRFRADPAAPLGPCHVDQDCEWRVFDFARGLDETAAMCSISMGAPQIMGFNHGAIGYDSPQEMFDAFSGDIRYQILGFFDFIKGTGSSSRMVQALERGQFDQFATFYNGPGQSAAYGARIRSHCDALTGLLPVDHA